MIELTILLIELLPQNQDLDLPKKARWLWEQDIFSSILIDQLKKLWEYPWWVQLDRRYISLKWLKGARGNGWERPNDNKIFLVVLSFWSTSGKEVRLNVGRRAFSWNLVDQKIRSSITTSLSQQMMEALT